MEHRRARTGIAALVFATLLAVFNWPLMSIPAPGSLLTWLFCAWAAGIGLLALSARLADQAEPGQPDAQPGAQPDGRTAPGLAPDRDEQAGSGDV